MGEKNGILITFLTACLKLELVELQNLREGFKHFVAEHWLPLIEYLHSISNTQCSCGTDARDGIDSAASMLVSEAYPSATN